MERKLGYAEKFWYMAERASPGNGIVLVRLRGPIDEDILRGTLDAIQRRHPLLGAHVEEREDGPWFVSEGTSPVPVQVMPRHSDDDWLPLTEREMHAGFPREQDPLLRVLMLKDDERADIMFVFGHLVGDLLSLVAFLMDFLKFATALAEGREPQVEPLPERPPAEELFPPQLTGDEAKKSRRELYKRFFATSMRNPQKLKPDVKVPPWDRRTRLLHRYLGRDATASLLDRCDELGISPHGAIVAAALTAMANEIESGRRRRRRGGRKPVVLGCQQSVSFRKHLRPRVRNTEVGLYGSGVVTFHDSGAGRSPWDLAPEISREFQDAVDRGEHLVFLPLLGRVDRWLSRKGNDPRRYLKFMTSFNSAALFATMTSAVPDIGEVGPFTVETVAGAVALSWLGAFAVGAPMSGDELMIGFAHAVPTISEERADRLADATIAILEEMAARPAAARSEQEAMSAL